jgi:uncharacterized protein YndB with AHSA1/START domain
MIESSTAPTAAANDDIFVKKELFVNASPQRCFDVFTTKMGTWWPLVTHHIGKADAKDVGMEPRPGGRLYEIGVDGSECDWGEVRAWEPPGRFVFAWQISAGWQFDKTIDTEVEVLFSPQNGGTRVELVHRKLGAYGAQTEEMRAALDSEGGWGGLLEAFGKAVAAS